MKGLTLPQKIMWLLIISIAVAGIWFAFYKAAIIYPPVTPTKLEELAEWDASDIKRLLNYYNCDDAPVYHSLNDIPDNLKEITKFCTTVSSYWAKAYRTSQYGSALEGAKRLRERNKSNE